MADETTAGPVSDVQVSVPVEAPIAKKTRAPRRPRTATAEGSATSVAAAPVKAKRGRRSKQVDAAAMPSADTQSANKAKAKAVVSDPKPKRSVDLSAKPNISTPVLDEIADLIQLEEENQRLRKLLSEKLRAENADLRKRLGLDR